MRIGFDNALYVKKQTEYILKRAEKFDNKLYIEFGGKLFDDLHAARVLPGFDANVKTKILSNLKDKMEIIFCIGAPDIEKNKIRSDFGITYGNELLRLMRNLREIGLLINGVVITQYKEQPAADIFRKQLERMGEKVYIHKYTKGYPNDIDTIVSDEGYGSNPYIPTTRPVVVVTAPGPSSGKLATCLSQLYHEYKRGVKAGYAKYETFPVWNLPLKHPVNIAYEAATADIKDRNMIDYFHLEQYGVSTVNYNRDLEVFPVVRSILSRILGEEVYKSPTDMGVNMVGYAITDDEVVQDAAKQEIIRRYFKTYNEYKVGHADLDTAHRVEILMKEIGVSPTDRKVVAPAIEKAEKHSCPAIAIELPDGTILTARDKNNLYAPAGVIMNAIKYLAGIDDKIKLIAPAAIEAILQLKKESLKAKSNKINLEEALIALSFSAATNPTVEFALEKLKMLSGCEAHSSVMLPESSLTIFRRLGINLTCEPVFAF
ncbi:MAG: DUF1846 domain-containing protein [Clostridia bacterium]|nr:DUF1846 domain-containing protein [Clostridia bacterium]